MAWVDYDQLAAVYDRDRASRWRPWSPGGRRWPPTCHRPPGCRCWTLGAGTGLFSAAIAHWFGAAVVAVEPSEGMRRQARPSAPTPASPTSVAGVSSCHCGTAAVTAPGCRPSSTTSATWPPAPASCAGCSALAGGCWSARPSPTAPSQAPDCSPSGRPPERSWPVPPPSGPPSPRSRPLASRSTGWSRSPTSRPPASRRPTLAPASGPTACPAAAGRRVPQGSGGPGTGRRRGDDPHPGHPAPRPPGTPSTALSTEVASAQLFAGPSEVDLGCHSRAQPRSPPGVERGVGLPLGARGRPDRRGGRPAQAWPSSKDGVGAPSLPRGETR